MCIYVHQPGNPQVLGAPLSDASPSTKPEPTTVWTAPPCQVVSRGLPMKPLWKARLDPTVLGLPRTSALFDMIDNDPKLSYNLPRVGCSAGQVIQHAQTIIQNTVDRLKPATFKIGFSHNPVWRFNNMLYGYKSGKDRFEHLCVVYVSCDSLPAAFLEAALIQIFQGDFLNNWHTG